MHEAAIFDIAQIGVELTIDLRHNTVEVNGGSFQFNLSQMERAL